MPIDGWRIHRRIGMSGGLFTRAVAREIGHRLAQAKAEAIQDRLGVIFREILSTRRPVAGALSLGDAVWDILAARRAGMMAVGVLTGGYGEDELARAGAYRIYRYAAELHASLDEIGILT